MTLNRLIFSLFACLIFSPTTLGAERIIDLTVGYKTVNFAGKKVTAISVNNQIPAPTLHFKEGDHVVINVHNQLNKETAIHWHGILIPWQMDGVLGVSQQGIAPGKTFQYRFTLHQSGTYWYHAHAGLQEQQGLYGALIIDPAKKQAHQYNKDIAIVLSDWTNTDPDQVLANLKKKGDYYAPRFPLQASLSKFIHDYRDASASQKRHLLSDYQSMQQMRMGIYDFSDVAYDAFLLNGHPNSTPWQQQVNVGDVVRLRFIGAAAGTLYHIKIPGTTMQIIHVQGNNIKPYEVSEFSLSPGETYDALVKIEENKPYIIYAESSDTLGAAYGALVTSPQQPIDYKNVPRFPEPLPITQTMMSMMMNDPIKAHHQASQTMHHGDMPMDHGGMHMATESTVIGDHFTTPDKHYVTTAGIKYEPMTAAVKTNNPNKPITATIHMELFGYMDHYMWFINGVPEQKAKPIILEPGKRYRLVFTNTSMMHHPMHIHGHWFILRNGNGAYDPLLHTIDVAPGATITADIDTDASGQWLFHCHMLYHMSAGMTRIVQYSTLLEITQDKANPENIIHQTVYHNRPIVRVDEVMPIDLSLIHHPMPHPHGIWLASSLEIGADFFNNSQLVTFKGRYGTDENKLELFMNEAEMQHGSISNADLDIFYWRLLSQFWSIKGGINYFYRPATMPYWQPGIGIEGLLPYFIDTDLRIYHYAGSTKFDIEFQRDTQITNNFFIQLGIRSIFASKTISAATIGSGLNQMYYTIHPHYRLSPAWDVFIEYEHQKNFGSYKNIQLSEGDSAIENTYTLGLSVLF